MSLNAVSLPVQELLQRALARTRGRLRRMTQGDQADQLVPLGHL